MPYPIHLAGRKHRLRLPLTTISNTNTMYDKETIEMLREVEAECNRFKKRLTAAVTRIKADDFSFGCKETGALKRAALDLKNELTRITQGFS